MKQNLAEPDAMVSEHLIGILSSPVDAREKEIEGRTEEGQLEGRDGAVNLFLRRSFSSRIGQGSK